MSQCCAKTAKGARCQLGVCVASECGLCAMHHKKHEKAPETIVFYDAADKETQPSASDENKAKKGAKKTGGARDADDDETSWNTNDLYNTALNLFPEIDDDVMQMVNPTNATSSSTDIWGSIAVNFANPAFSVPNKKQKAPKKRLTPKLLLNLSLWMFYRDCCKKPDINNVIRNQIIRDGLVKGALLATKDKVVEDNGVAKTVKVEIIPYQLVKYATDQVWQKLPEAMRQKYFQAVRDDYTRRVATQ
jgi:hypothetical protein